MFPNQSFLEQIKSLKKDQSKNQDLRDSQEVRDRLRTFFPKEI